MANRKIGSKFKKEEDALKFLKEGGVLLNDTVGLIYKIEGGLLKVSGDRLEDWMVSDRNSRSGRTALYNLALKNLSVFINPPSPYKGAFKSDASFLSFIKSGGLARNINTNSTYYWDEVNGNLCFVMPGSSYPAIWSSLYKQPSYKEFRKI